MVLVRCNDCGYEWDSKAKNPRCPNKGCKSLNVTPIEGVNTEENEPVESNTKEVVIEEDFEPVIDEVIDVTGPAIPVSERAMMKLDQLSEMLRMDVSEIIERLIDDLYAKVSPFVVKMEQVVRRGSVYEIDVEGLENKVFLRLSIKFTELRQALIVANSFNQQGTTSVVAHDGRYWNVFYELPEPKDVFELEQFRDVFGRKLILRVS